MTTQHALNRNRVSPLPWIFFSDSLFIQDKNKGLVAETYDIDDAAFIVRACNAHEELVEALEAALECIEYNDLAAINTTTIINAALAKAKGE